MELLCVYMELISLFVVVVVITKQQQILYMKLTNNVSLGKLINYKILIYSKYFSYFQSNILIPTTVIIYYYKNKHKHQNHIQPHSISIEVTS